MMKGRTKGETMDPKKLSTIAANFAQAVHTQRPAMIGGGEFGPAECKAAADALQEFPAMLAALQWALGALEKCPPPKERRRDLGTVAARAWHVRACGDIRRILARIDGTPSGEAVAPTAQPAGDLLDDMAGFLAGFEDCEDNGELARDLLQRIETAGEGKAGPARLCVIMDGGLIQDVLGDGGPVEFVRVDYDTEGADKSELTDIAGCGWSGPAIVSGFNVGTSEEARAFTARAFAIAEAFGGEG
jgi:hypothetical protein